MAMLFTSTEPSSRGLSPPVSRASYSAKPPRNVETPAWVTAKPIDEWTGIDHVGAAGISCLMVCVVVVIAAVLPVAVA